MIHFPQLRRPLPWIGLVALVFGTAWLLGRWGTLPGHRDAGGLSPGLSGEHPPNGTLARPPNHGLTLLRENVARQIDAQPRPFSGTEFDKLVADRSGTGGESAESYAGRWARADPDGLAAWILQARWKPHYVTWVLFHTWAQTDDRAARTALEKWPAHWKDERRQAIGAMIAGLGSTHPAAAGALAMDHLPLLAEGSSYIGRSPFFQGFKQSDAFWKVIAALPRDASRNKVLAAYLNLGVHNDAEIMKRWKDASVKLRLDLVEGGFPNGKNVDEAIFDGLPDMILEHALKTGDRSALYNGLREQVRRDSDRLGDSVALSRERMTGRDRAEFPAELISLAARQNFPKALDYWRSLPDGLMKVRAAGALEMAAPPEFKSRMEAEISKLPPADIKRARE